MFNFTLTREQIEYKGHNTIHNMIHCSIAGNVFPTGCALISYLKVT